MFQCPSGAGSDPTQLLLPFDVLADYPVCRRNPFSCPDPHPAPRGYMKVGYNYVCSSGFLGSVRSTCLLSPAPECQPTLHLEGCIQVDGGAPSPSTITTSTTTTNSTAVDASSDLGTTSNMQIADPNAATSTRTYTITTQQISPIQVSSTTQAAATINASAPVPCAADPYRYYPIYNNSCNSLEPGTTCTAWCLDHRCVQGRQLLLHCPADNMDVEAVPVLREGCCRVMCDTCQVGSFHDNNLRPDTLDGVLELGQVHLNGTIQTGVRGYRVYFEDSRGHRSEIAGTTSGAWDQQNDFDCCRNDSYIVRLGPRIIPPGASTLAVVVVLEAGDELPLSQRVALRPPTTTVPRRRWRGRTSAAFLWHPLRTLCLLLLLLV